MKKTMGIVVFAVLAAMGTLQSAEVDVKPVPYVKNEKRVKAFDEYLREVKHFRANSWKDLEKNLRDDYLLANHFLKNGMNDDERARLTNMVNRYLAQREVQRIQKSIGISDDVTRSYYLDHLRDYKLKPIVSLKNFHFKTLEEADAFYRFAKENGYAKALQKAKTMGVEPIDYTHPLNMMQPLFRLSLKNRHDSGYFTPPQYVPKDFVVLYVADIKQRDGYIPYDKVKRAIARELWQKTYLRKRMEILSSYDGEKQ